MSRVRSHSDPATPPHTPYASRRSNLPHISAQMPGASSSSPRARPSESSTSSLQSSFSNLTLTARARSPLAQFLDEYPGSGRRSETPSVTSVSDDGDEEVPEGGVLDERTKGWVERGRRKGKGKERETEEGIVEGLPPEILAQVSRAVCRAEQRVWEGVWA